MKYRVMMTRCEEDYKMAVAPNDSYVSAGDLVKLEGDNTGVFREVVLADDYITEDGLKQYEKRMGYKIPRVLNYYDFKTVIWEEDHNGENVSAVKGE